MRLRDVKRKIRKEIKNMQVNIVTTIEDTLQEKTIDTFDYILEECKKTIHRRKISLK